jgi:hypothetical protein
MYKADGSLGTIERVRCDKCFDELVKSAEAIGDYNLALRADIIWPKQTRKEREMKLVCENCGLNDNATSPHVASQTDTWEKIARSWTLIGCAWILIGLTTVFNLVARLNLSAAVTLISNIISIVFSVPLIVVSTQLWRNRK